MLKQSVRTIGIVLKYARGVTIIKLLQLLLAAALTPLSTLFTQRLIDYVTLFIKGEDVLSSLILYVVLLLISMFFMATGGFFDGILFISLKRKLNQHLTPVIVNKFKKLDYACLEDKDTQDTINRMSHDPQDNILNLFLNVASTITIFISIIGSAIIFSQVGIWFSAGFIALLFPMMWCDFKSMDMMNTMFTNQSTDERRMHYYGELLSTKSSIFELKIFGSTEYILNKWRSKAQTVLDERVKTTMHSQKYYLISTILFKVWSFFVVISLIYSIINHSITIGLFTALIGSTGAILSSAESLSHSFGNVSKRILLIKHYDNFLSLPEIPDIKSNVEIKNPHIVFENVTFTYPKTDKVILSGVSFEVNPMERVALVGENGAGKSTIIKLLCRLYIPDSGMILINGVDIKKYSQASLRQVYSVVFQDFGSYQLTLRENIAFGSIDKINNDTALKLAQQQGLADSIGDNLDMNLGKLTDDGVDLSGGQWQRIAIARACVSDSTFVILDEPTASLDPIAESEMYKGFVQVMKDKGSIIISHRLASARLSDKIIVLNNGQVAQIGTHDTLSVVDGLYSTMWTAQSAWYKGGAESEK